MVTLRRVHLRLQVNFNCNESMELMDGGVVTVITYIIGIVITLHFVY